jgi:hypothetical protein
MAGKVVEQIELARRQIHQLAAQNSAEAGRCSNRGRQYARIHRRFCPIASWRRNSALTRATSSSTENGFAR